jgi:hypothetical protein
MVSKSVLIDLTNCTRGTCTNQSQNGNNVNNEDSIPTKSYSFNTTTDGHDLNSQSDDAHYINNKNKKLKVSKDKAIAISTNYDSTTTTNETQSVQVSQVWNYAVRCSNQNFSICCLCPDQKKISTNNGSTSTLRKHLVAKHGLHELALPNNKRKRTVLPISNEKQLNLHELFTKCIIRDGRTFNDLQKPGLKKILQGLISGEFILMGD